MQANSDNYRNSAEHIPNGPSCIEIARIAKENRTNICAGLIEKSGLNYSISHVVFGPMGFIQKQRKIFPQNPDKCKFFTPGKLINAFNLLGHKCAILACADWMEAETTVISGLEEVSLILAPTGDFDTKMFPTLKDLMCAKALHTNSVILAPFNHNNSDESEIPGALAFAYDGEELIYATRPVGVEMIHSLDISPIKPRKRWGGFESRVGFLKDSLNSYLAKHHEILENE
jgi:predicted amidohydrolase